MAIASTDVKYYLSGGSVGAGNSDPAGSLGGVSTSTLGGTDLFDNITSTESADGDTEYRAIFVKNTNGTDTAYNVKHWIQSNTPSTATEVKIALCDEGASATIETVANEGTAPSGPSFALCANEAASLDLGDLAPGAYYGVWIERVVTAGAGSFANDGITLRTKIVRQPDHDRHFLFVGTARCPVAGTRDSAGLPVAPGNTQAAGVH